MPPAEGSSLYISLCMGCGCGGMHRCLPTEVQLIGLGNASILAWQKLVLKILNTALTGQACKDVNDKNMVGVNRRVGPSTSVVSKGKKPNCEAVSTVNARSRYGLV